MKKRKTLLPLILSALFSTAVSAGPSIQKEAKDFLKMYVAFDQPIYTAASESEWKASTDVKDESVGERTGASKVAATFWGNKYVIERTRFFLKHRKELTPITVLELREVLANATRFPATIPDVVGYLVEAESNQSGVLDSYEFCLDRSGAKCKKPITPNQIDTVLKDEKNLKTRLQYWQASKEIGVKLKDGLVTLRDLRNRVATEMGYSSFFDFEVSDYGMKTPEMMSLLDRSLADIAPVYQQLHCWAKNELAGRYKQPVPKRIPAHWLGNRWGQAWPGLVPAAEFDDLFKGKSARWIVETAENFYVTLGFPKLPPSFWEKSDLYALAAGSNRKKNTHASAWHLDLEHDVRSLMSVEPDWYWFGTAHHELGHIYYYLSYTRPEVPVLLREGANRAFHEAIGDLIFMAATSPDYLRKVGLLPKDRKIDETQLALSDAMGEGPVFLPFSAGTMSHFEHDLYEKKLSKEELNSRWWQYVEKFQGIEAPSERPADTCDACTKTHINDDPAQYYDYALAALIKHQLQDHICRKILNKNVHNCDFTENPKVGTFLNGILKLGKTRDWRKVIQEATGSPISSKAMLEYYRPVQAYLELQNKGRDCSF